MTDGKGLSVSHIVLQDVVRGRDENRYRWKPFVHNPQFVEPWWDRAGSSGNPHYILATDGADEVARIELQYPHRVGTIYRGVPDLGPKAMNLQLIEVALNFRSKGVGTRVVRKLASSYPAYRLLAMSEGADAFWASLGWSRYDANRPRHSYRPLFVAPKLWS